MAWSKILTVGVSAAWLAVLGCEDRGGGERRAGGPSTAEPARPGDAGTPGAQAGRQGGASAIGEVVSAKDDEVVLRQQGDPKELKLKVDGTTQVLIDGRQASADQLREGTQVRASFDSSKGEPLATRIEAIGGTAGGTGSRDPGERPGGSAGTTGGLGGSSSHTPGQTGGPGGESSTSAGDPNAPRGGSTTR